MKFSDRIKDYINEEEGTISHSKLVAVGTLLMIFGVVFRGYGRAFIQGYSIS